MSHSLSLRNGTENLVSDQIGNALAGIVGERFVRTGADIGERYRLDLTRKYSGNPAWLVKPGSTEEVSAVMKLAHDAGVPVTVVGGQSGTCGAAVPSDSGLALSLERMDRIIAIDTLSMTMTVEAGCILQVAQEAAEAEGSFLPLDLGSRGSAMIGGAIGTNAGGNRVLRWGMMRDMVLGLEAVLADGTVLSSLTGLLKDNAGYRWKDMVVGSEGTLAIVTKAVLRLRPMPTTQQTALLGLPGFEEAIKVLRRLETTLSGQLSSFELMWEDFYRTHTEAQLGQRPRPMPLGHPVYALVEAMGGNENADSELFQAALMELVDNGLIADAVIAQSAREREALWAVREDLQPGYAPLQPFLPYDVSMPVADMPAYVEKARAAVLRDFPDATLLFYGHAGDGNLHVLFSIGRMDKEIEAKVDTAIYDAVSEFGGSIAAEHGVGVSRIPYIDRSRSPEELALMRRIKQAFDPEGILNPGKVINPPG